MNISFTKISDKEWGVRAQGPRAAVQALASGQAVQVTKRDRSTTAVVLGQKKDTWSQGSMTLVAVWTIARKPRRSSDARKVANNGAGFRRAAPAPAPRRFIRPVPHNEGDYEVWNEGRMKGIVHASSPAEARIQARELLTFYADADRAASVAESMEAVA